jgi:hypothetical protein
MMIHRVKSKYGEEYTLQCHFVHHKSDVALRLYKTWNLNSVLSSKHEMCDISGYHSGTTEDSSLLGRDSVWTGKQFPAFQKLVIPSSTGSGSSRNDPTNTRMFDMKRIMDIPYKTRLYMKKESNVDRTSGCVWG